MPLLLWLNLALGGESADLARTWGPSVVTLESVDLLGNRLGNGTGFFISADGRLVTNAHVVDGEVTRALLADGTTREIEGLVAIDHEADVAILKVEGDGYRPFTLREGRAPTIGDRVVVIGSPGGLAQTVTEGNISAVRAKGVAGPGTDEVAKGRLLQITAGVAPGSSGSPVLDAAGGVVGVAQSANNHEELYLAVDVAEVLELRASVPPAAPLQSLGSPLGYVAWSVAGVGAVLIAAFAVSSRLAAKEKRKRRR